MESHEKIVELLISINFAGSTEGEAVIWVEDAPTINFDGSSSFTISVWTKIDPFTNTDEMTLLLKGDNGMGLPNVMDIGMLWLPKTTKYVLL